MLSVLGIILLVLLSVCVSSNFLTLPGNWFMAFFILLWAFLISGNTFDTWFFAVFFGLLILGEVLEFYLQIRHSKKVGASNTANFLGIVGAILGAIFCVPFLFGLGAIFGALAGAWIGTFIGEFLLVDKSKQESILAANAALYGKFLGIIIKFGIGCYLVFHTANYLFPDHYKLQNSSVEITIEQKKTPQEKILENNTQQEKVPQQKTPQKKLHNDEVFI